MRIIINIACNFAVIYFGVTNENIYFYAKEVILMTYNTQEQIQYINSQSKKFLKLNKKINEYLYAMSEYFKVNAKDLKNAYDINSVELFDGNFSTTFSDSKINSIETVDYKKEFNFPNYVYTIPDALQKISYWAMSLINISQLIPNNIKPYISSLFAYPFVHFVYNKYETIFIWNICCNTLRTPEKLNLHQLLNIPSNSCKSSFIRALYNLLKAFHEITIKESEYIDKVIAENGIGITTNPFTFIKNIIKKEDIGFFEDNGKSNQEKLKQWNKLMSEKPKYRTYIEPAYIQGCAVSIGIYDGVKQYVLSNLCFESDFFLNYNYYNFCKINCNIYDILNKIGLSPFKQNLFEICDNISGNILNNFYILKQFCFKLNNNIIAQSPDGKFKLLNEEMYYIIKEYSNINLNNKNIKIKKILKNVYDCIYEQSFLESNINTNNLKNTTAVYKYKNIFYGYISNYNNESLCYGFNPIIVNNELSNKGTPSKELCDLIKFMTNNDYSMFKTFIKLLTASLAKKIIIEKVIYSVTVIKRCLAFIKYFLKKLN